MLKILPVDSLRAREEVLAQFDFSQSTWVVSDLRTKFELQEFLLQKNGHFEDHSVLRARELWTKLLFRVEPQIRIVSSDYIKARLNRDLQNEKIEKYGLKNVKAETLFRYIEELLPILSHPDDYEALENWFQENEGSRQRWLPWFNLALQMWQNLKKDQLLAPTWIAAYLVNKLDFEQHWERPLLFDLGSELLAIESELIGILAQKQEVQLLAPSPSWMGEYPLIQNPYQKLIDRAPKATLIKSPESKDRSVEKVFRFSSCLGEVKQAVAQVRLWLEQGIPINQMLLVAPDIEEYWPALRVHLQYEGIPAAKDISISIQSRPNVLRWRSKLWSKALSLKTEDLELAVFDPKLNPALTYDEFQALYSLIYTPTDLERDARVSRLYHSKIDLESPMKRDQFVRWTLESWDDFSNTEDLEIMIREILKDVSVNEALGLKHWIEYLDGLISRKETKLEHGSSEGLSCLSLMSAHSRQFTHRIFLGLTQDQIGHFGESLFKTQEVLSLEFATGHLLNHPDRCFREFELRWLQTGSPQESQFYFASHDFAGTPQAPSVFWLEKCVELKRKIEDLDSPFLTRFDELLEQGDLSSEQTELRRLQIQRDLGQLKYESLGIKIDRSLSPGSIETYQKCSFKFAAEKVLRLVDPEIVDLDLDARGRGSLIHGVLEQLTQEPMRFDWSAEELRQLAEKVLLDNPRLKFASEDFRKLIIESHVKIGQRFLNYEKEWRQKFPNTETILQEGNFKFYADPDSERLSREDLPNGHMVQGKIDRVDCNKMSESKQAAVIDYKSSLGAHRSPKSWIDNKEYQLLSYILAVEEGFIPEIEAMEVVAASYLGLRTMKRKGFVSPASDVNFNQAERSSEISEDQLQELKIAFFEILFSTIRDLWRGRIEPVPTDVNICNDCYWSNLCRAPHLNS